MAGTLVYCYLYAVHAVCMCVFVFVCARQRFHLGALKLTHEPQRKHTLRPVFADEWYISFLTAARISVCLVCVGVVSWFACLPARLPACLPAGLRACRPLCVVARHAERLPFLRAAHGGAGPGAAAGEAPRGQGADGAQNQHQGRAGTARGTNTTFIHTVHKQNKQLEETGDTSSACFVRLLSSRDGVG